MIAGLATSIDTSAFSVGKAPYYDCGQAVATWFYNDAIQNNTEIKDNSFWDYQILGENYFRLQSFLQLKKGWNGYDGEEISNKVIDNTSALLQKLSFQPKIFPTGRNSIQVEYYNNDDNLFELEISSNQYSLYLVRNGNETEKDVTMAEACELMNGLVYGW